VRSVRMVKRETSCTKYVHRLGHGTWDIEHRTWQGAFSAYGKKGDIMYKICTQTGTWDIEHRT
jgi:hypothetical protein